MGMCIGMRIGMCIGMRIGMCMGMCMGMCIGMRKGMCIGMSMGMGWRRALRLMATRQPVSFFTAAFTAPNPPTPRTRNWAQLG